MGNEIKINIAVTDDGTDISAQHNGKDIVMADRRNIAFMASVLIDIGKGILQQLCEQETDVTKN